MKKQKAKPQEFKCSYKTALAEYESASPESKKLLEKLFGSAAFPPKKPVASAKKPVLITGRVKTFASACSELGKSAAKELSRIKGLSKTTAAYEKLQIIVAALNEGWKPDWDNISEYKYYPWFRVIPDASKPSGFGLSYGVYDFAYINSGVGVRLVFKTRALAEYAGRIFISEYSDFILG